MDRLDRKILKLLERNSAWTSEALGQKVGLSASAAHRRVRALESDGAILGYRARLSHGARGRPSTMFVQVTLTDQRRDTMETFEAALARTTVIREAYLMSGEADYLLKVQVPDDDSYERVHRDVLSIMPGVRRLVSQFTLRTITSDD